MAESYRRRGWHSDPYGLHAERFFYADNQPGRLVPRRQPERVLRRHSCMGRAASGVRAAADPDSITSEPQLPLGPPPLIESSPHAREIKMTSPFRNRRAVPAHAAER